ncbi:magnesium transporter [Desulfitispora alkaliphila]|uniref:magnesium transporter n=1 Tax=Desulfitispora alkaliphila TaxID=622674 RepID=UPI003D227D7F
MTLSNGFYKQLVVSLDRGNPEEIRELFDELHSYDQAQFLLKLDQEQRKKMLQYLGDEELAEITQELEYEQQQVLIEEMGNTRSAKVLVEMSSDDAADLLGDMEEEKKQEILRLINDEESADMRELMKYPDNTAGGIMTTEYIVLPKHYTAEETVKKLREIAPDAETVYYLYVVDEEDKLLGVLSLRELIIASPEITIDEIMYERVVSVPVDMDQEEVANIMEKYDFLAVPVVDERQHLVGIITVDDAVDVMKDEASEDMAKFGGISGKDSGVMDLSVTSFEAAKKRIPWLVLLLGIGIVAGNIIHQFEETLEAVWVLAIFIPMIADMAGNTGTQSLAVVVRGLATGQFQGRDAFRLIKREAGVGILIGLTNGILISLIAGIWQQSMALGFVIGMSLSISLFFATLAGTIVPLIMVKLKVDPAVASGPFITTVNDILGLTIYFSIATAFMSYL